ncbi:MAG: sigma 54-interacting transcriptional regulator [Terriglobales bacterium]
MLPKQEKFEEELWPEARRYQLLRELTDVVARATSLPDAFQELAPLVLAVTGGEMLNLSLYDPQEGRMRSHYWKRNRESGEFDSLPVDQAASGWVWKYQEQISIPDTEREQRFPDFVPSLVDHGVRSYIAVPMTTPANRFGALGLGKDVRETATGDDLQLLSRVATLGALVLEKDRAYRAFEEQQSLAAISRDLSSILELERLLPAILFSLRGIARYDQTILSLLDRETNLVHRYGNALEWEPPLNGENRVPLYRSLSSAAIGSRKVTFFTREDLRTMDDPLAQAMNKAGMGSVCSVPLIVGDRVWGTLNPSSIDENAFGTTEVEYLQQVATQIAIALQNACAYREIAELKDRLAQEKRYYANEVLAAVPSDDIIGASSRLQRVLDDAAIVADTDSTVLITGETGTGKERIARMLHGMSRRRDNNFIKVNCAAIPTGLLESELFGHEKGAFTGAVSQKIGRLELADKGTLLLDEVGEIALELQPKLLRVLQDREFERLGGTKTIRVNVRVIAATNRDLLQAVEEGEFRRDLFYRLHVFPLHLPPLRERREDIPMLIEHFVKKCAARLGKQIESIPRAAVEAMSQWNWPGNIRELENFIERSVILSEGNRLNPPLGELRPEVSRESPAATLRDAERDHIAEILRQTHGALSGPNGAAARLGLKRTTLQYKMQRLKICRGDYLD